MLLTRTEAIAALNLASTVFETAAPTLSTRSSALLLSVGANSIDKALPTLKALGSPRLVVELTQASAGAKALFRDLTGIVKSPNSAANNPEMAQQLVENFAKVAKQGALNLGRFSAFGGAI